MPLSVYCSGSITKGPSDEKKLCWTDDERAQVREGAQQEVIFLNPDDPIIDRSNTLGQFGRDMYQVMVASVIIVDARERRGLGIGVEMAAAATFGTPIIVVAPRNSKYRVDMLEYRGVIVQDYVHPHVAALATAVVDDFLVAGNVLPRVARQNCDAADLPAWLSRAIDEYRLTVLPHDVPMREALRELGVDLVSS